uniref:MTOR-associated protein MEAK7 n=1 Tax=Leptobrachium leishanense TaxID=445787 RepID=A0A8C5QP75_9ANUR
MPAVLPVSTALGLPVSGEREDAGSVTCEHRAGFTCVRCLRLSMGNAESGQYRKRLLGISPEEQAEIEQRFDRISQGKKCVDLQTFQEAVGCALLGPMTKRIFTGIQGANTGGNNAPASADISREQFVFFLVDVIRGNAEEKSCVLLRMIAAGNAEHVSGQQVQQFLEDLVASLLHALTQQKLLNGWNAEKTPNNCSGVSTLATQCLSQLKTTDQQNLDKPELLNASCSRATLEDWLYRAPMVSTFLRILATHGLSALKNHTDIQRDLGNLIPKCKGTKNNSAFVSLLDLPSVIYLNSHLPYEVQHRWRLLFSTRLHGESFSKLCGCIVDQGPCLLVLKDSDGFIFGGFASQEWEVKPQYRGDTRCFLFTASPKLNVYTCTGYNDHYMYLNHGQQTMPNGLGMGGQHNYFGLWLDSDYGTGHSKAKPRCTTYNSPQLSSKEDFSIDALEVWAVGDVPEHLLAKNKKSILDADPEVRALLEMTGKARQSDGLRDVVDDDN